METIGIICEYNPFHNGHVYHINKIKEMYPDSIIILCVNGYFGERGDVSILSKEDKTKLALNNGVNIVVELPFVFASNSADTFAEASVKILNYLKVDKIIFGSESNDINKLTLIAKKQLEEDFSLKIKEEIKVETTSQTPYTTVITNEYLLILDILKEYKEYNASTMLFLLRNHSQNMEQLIKGDHISFIEKYTDQIIGAINGDVSKSKLENLDFPVKAKFGRFSPVPFSTGSPSFMTFGDTENDIEVEQSP